MIQKYIAKAVLNWRETFVNLLKIQPKFLKISHAGS